MSKEQKSPAVQERGQKPTEAAPMQSEHLQSTPSTAGQQALRALARLLYWARVPPSWLTFQLTSLSAWLERRAQL